MSPHAHLYTRTKKCVKGAMQLRTWRFLFTHTNKDYPSSIFNSFTEQKVKSYLCCLYSLGRSTETTRSWWSTGLCLEPERVSAKARGAPPPIRVIFTQILNHSAAAEDSCWPYMAVWGSCNTLELWWQPSRALGLLPLSGRVSPATHSLNLPPYYRFLPYTYCRLLFLHFYFLQNIHPIE